MSRQIAICFSQEDNREFERLAQTQLGAVLIPDHNQTRCPEQVQSLVTPMEDGFRTTGYLARWPDVQRIILENVHSQGYWVLDSLRSPVVEFDGGFEGHDFIRCGRLYLSTGFYNDAGRWVDKPDDFLKWADTVLKLAKKRSRRDSELRTYLGESAQEKKSQGWKVLPST